MKKLFVLIITVFLFISCVPKEQVKVTKIEDNIYKLLPETAVAVLKVSSYKKALDTFEKFDKKEIKYELEQFKKEAGFDPLNLNDLDNIGINTNKNFGFYVSDISWSDKKDLPCSVTMFVPCTDKAKVTKTIKDIFARNLPKLKWQQKENVHYIQPEKNEHLVITEREDYLFITINLEKTTEDLLNSLKFNVALSETPEFKKISKQIDTTEDICLFANFRNLISKQFLENINSRYERYIDVFKQYNDMTVTMDLDSKDLIINSVINIKEGSDLLKIYKFKFEKDSILKITSNPLLLFTIGANFTEYEKFFKKSQPDLILNRYYRAVEDINKNLELDVNKDVIENMAGSFNFGIFDGQTLNQMNFNLFTSISIKNEDKMNEVINKVISKLKEKNSRLIIKKDTIAGVEFNVVYVQFYRVYFGVYKNHFLFSMNKNFLEDTITGKLENGFVKNMEPELAENIKGDIYNVFLSFDEINKAINNIFPEPKRRAIPTIQKIQEILMKFEYLSSNTKVNGNAFYWNTKLKTRFEQPFFKALFELIDEQRKKRMEERLKKKEQK